MTNKREGGKIKGGQVFIFSKDIKNEGQIVSSGEGAKTHVETERYSGKGSVESHQYKRELTKWYQLWWVKYIILPLFVGLILLGISLYLNK